MSKPTLSIALAEKIHGACLRLKADFKTELIKTKSRYAWVKEGPDQLELFCELLSVKSTNLQDAADWAPEEDSASIIDQASCVSHLIEAVEAIHRCIEYCDQQPPNYYFKPLLVGCQQSEVTPNSTEAKP